MRQHSNQEDTPVGPVSPVNPVAPVAPEKFKRVLAAFDVNNITCGGQTRQYVADAEDRPAGFGSMCKCGDTPVWPVAPVDPVMPMPVAPVTPVKQKTITCMPLLV